LRSQAQSLCETCEVFAGSGSTYHYWGDTGGVVVPVTVTWGNGRYELGYFRMSTEQVLRSRVMAHPYIGLSVSRRWQLFEIGPVGCTSALAYRARASLYGPERFAERLSI
jgi:hypothetical protein